MGEDALSSGLTGHRADGSKWRERVQAPVVELAWETLCGSILQEVRPGTQWEPSGARMHAAKRIHDCLAAALA